MKVLKEYKLSPLSRYCTWGWVPARDVIHSIGQFKEKSSPKKPEASALQFYLGEHVLSSLSMDYDEFEPLPPEVSDAVRRISISSNIIAAHMFAYLLYICVREVRHASNEDTDAIRDINPTLYYQVYEQVYGCDCSSISERFLGLAIDKDVSLSDLTDWLVSMFNEGSYSKGYGGSAWASIAECLDDFVSGASPLNMMVDKSFALAHNGGPIFNKGMFFTSYDAYLLGLILDVQRSGQIPELIRDGHISYDSDVASVASHSIPLIEGKLRPYLDWMSVECTNAQGDYEVFKHKQEQKHGKAAQQDKNVWASPLLHSPVQVIGRSGLI